MVPKLNGSSFTVRKNGHFDRLAVACVLGGVVEDVEKHLLEPLRVAGHERDLLLGRVVDELHPVLPQQLLIGEDGVLELALDVEQLHAQVEAAVLDAGELQQLLDEARQARGLLGDDGDAAAGVALDGSVEHERFAPAGDGGQGRAQLVRDRRDELRLHFFAAADLLRQLVDRGRKAAELIVALHRQLRAVAPASDRARDLRDLLDRA